MDIEAVAQIIGKIAKGFEDACFQCMCEKSGMILVTITEQLRAGRDGEEKLLDPTYDDDPYFDEEGEWFHRSGDYKKWKSTITPPDSGVDLGLPARPAEVPNLYIDGTFWSQIDAVPKDKVLDIDPGIGDGPDIVAKYGEKILTIGPHAVEFFNREYLSPAIERFFTECGYE